MTPLSEAEVRVVHVDLDALWAEPVVEGVLSADELGRAARFVPPVSRRRYMSRRWALRTLLGTVLDSPAAGLEFGEGARGKPFLTTPADSGLEFNVSHSGPAALIAITRGRRVGVDIERIRELPEAGDLVERFFADDERKQFRSLPADRRHDAFFSTWARKEAVAKATGRGIADTLQRFAVTVDPAGGPEQLSVEWHGDDTVDWRLIDLPVPEGFVGALAAEGGGWQLSFSPWLPSQMDP